MTRAAAVAIDLVMLDEGGIKDVKDGKGLTRFGQTPAWLASNGFTPPETPEHARQNYDVWMQRFGFDKLCEIDVTLGHFVTDDAVHAGEHGAVTRLQQSLVGVTVDGKLGPLTLDAVRRADLVRLAHDVIAAKIEHRTELLGSTDPDRRGVAKGWGRRLAKQVRALGA